MKYTTVEEFVKSFADEGHEQSLWEMIDEYKKWKYTGSIGDCLLRSNARAFCSNLTIPAHYHVEYMEKIAIGIYEYFAMKYREMKNEESTTYCYVPTKRE
jgi:hypothetical protein